MIRICCVHSRGHSGIVDDAAAPAASSVDEPGPRRQCDRVLLPMKQISRADVAPMHGAMNRRDRVVLKEDVKAAVNPAKTIRIVQPSMRGPDMQRRKADISHRAKVPGSPPASGALREQRNW
jgi:hypothetical protein